MTFNSIKLWLLVSINILMIVILGMTASISYHNTLHELDEMYDAQLAQTARLLMTLYSNHRTSYPEEKIIIPVPQRIDNGEHLSSAEERTFFEHKYESKIAFQLWKNKKLMMLSENAETFPVMNQTEGFQEYTANNYKWITYSLFDRETSVWVHTSQREDIRAEMSGHMAETQLRPLLLLIIPLSIIIYFLIAFALRPLSELSRQLNVKQPEMLTEVSTSLPHELLPIQVSINRLLNKIRNYIEKEKRFIIDASHELRTPLSILQLHAQNLESSLSESDRKQAIEAVGAGSKRMVHLVNQLLALARVEQSTLPEKNRINIQELVEKSMSQLHIDMLEKVNWHTSIEKEAYLYGDSSLLQIVFRNLLDNAAKYAEENSSVNIEVKNNNEGDISITIENKSIIQVEANRLGERFYRHGQHQHINGSGLGLSIVNLIIQLHQGEIWFTQKNSIFRVEILFPVNINN
ncbi:ATP-binding protein [Methylophaga pinxianii]|jgi:two-component system sensor histidine kinase QseC|uniref:ATP-binding protein n=1 Tax=Methylophaga pinxianii TaxID=2881052 RepID=UPI001CF1B9A0|nr:ATP-binding protein [Methylophaga pinxianii]MCB2425987.1 GHKL domain-containing protein [Methylophaga pinxianii]UPH47185.1 ATP-binding protein [Methylophaga pinxianii]